MKNLRSLFGILTAIIMITACTSATDGGAPPAEQGFTQQVGDLLHGEVMAVAYSGFRAGQHPDRGAGAKNPTTMATRKPTGTAKTPARAPCTPNQFAIGRATACHSTKMAACAASPLAAK